MGETLYKVLGPNRMPVNGGVGQWPYRKWTDPVRPVPCEQGYHVCRLDQLLSWLGPEIWEVEVRGRVIDNRDKLVAEQARLIRRTNWHGQRVPRLFAADCAERVLHLFERERPGDDRPRLAIETARRFAAGNATVAELDAAGDAARAAARAAGEAAGDAARAAWAAGEAAWAAGDAAWDARAAAWAAGDAARAAAKAAGDAAWDASAAARAAGDAERRWQIERLIHYLNGGLDE